MHNDANRLRLSILMKVLGAPTLAVPLFLRLGRDNTMSYYRNSENSLARHQPDRAQQARCRMRCSGRPRIGSLCPSSAR